jgi:hypothetical protein
MNLQRKVALIVLFTSFIASTIIAARSVRASATFNVYPGPSTPIQTAINSASLGDTIIVHDGTYVENVNIDKLLVLTAASHPVIDGNLAGPCVQISANGVTVNGFELIHGTYGVASWGTDDSVLSNNIIHDIYNVGGYAGCGIMFWSDTTDFDNNIISGNEIYNCDRQGIYIGGETSGLISEDNTITRNKIHNNGLYTYPNGPDASAYGIQLSFADNNDIDHNDIFGHDDWFPWPGYDFAQGIYLFDSNNNHILCNDLHDNNYGVGIWRPSRAAGTNRIECNNIMHNTGYGVITYDAPPNVDARNNWWDSATGPTHSSNPGGTGDKVSNNVDFTPWLTTVACPPVGGEWMPVDPFALSSRLIPLFAVTAALTGSFVCVRRKTRF